MKNACCFTLDFLLKIPLSFTDPDERTSLKLKPVPVCENSECAAWPRSHVLCEATFGGVECTWILRGNQGAVAFQEEMPIVTVHERREKATG